MKNRMSGKWIAALLMLLVLCLCAAGNAESTGTCGEGLTWVLSDEGVLTVSGTGAMQDYGQTSDPAPWRNTAEVHELVVENGVTGIGDFAFYSVRLAKITLPDSLETIGTQSFGLCEELAEITVPPALKKIGTEAFDGCSALDKVKVSACADESIVQWFRDNGYGSKLVDLPHKGNLEAHDRVAPTCGETGTEAYWQCSFCGRMYKDAEGGEEISAPETIPTVPHDWNAPEYVWAEDNSSVTASRTCKNDPTHTEEETAETAFEVIEDPETESGYALMYTSKAFANGAFEAQSKKVTKILPEGLSIGDGTLSLRVGEKQKPEVSFEPYYAWSALTWTTDDKTVAAVSSNGTITAKGEGRTTVTAKAKNGVKGSVAVKVTAPDLEKIVLNKTGTQKMVIDGTLKLKASPKPKAAHLKVKWSSSDTSVVTVSETGKLKAVGKGSAVITAEDEETGITASLNVTVRLKDPTEITLNKTGTVQVTVGKTLQLKAKIAPKKAEKTVKWSSDNKKVAKVDQTGLVTALKSGTAVITAKTVNGLEAKVTIRVKGPKPTKVTLDQTGLLYLQKGKTVQLKATLSPDNAESELTWESSDPKIAKVDQSGNVKGLKNGTVEITVETENKKKASVTVRVYAPNAPDKVELDEEGTLPLKKGRSLQLHAKQTPEVCTGPLTWSSSDESVAAVSEKGKVTAVSKGTVTITVKAENKKKDTVKITVYDPNDPDAVSITDGSKMKLPVCVKHQLTVVQKPEECTAPLAWESSDESVVIVSSKGELTARKVGTATVTVTAKNGKSDSIRIDVTRNIADHLCSTPQYSDIRENSQEIVLKSVEIISDSQVDCEYYLIFNHAPGLTTKWFTYITAAVNVDGNVVLKGTLEKVPIRLASPGVELFKVSFKDDLVKFTNVDLNAMRDKITDYDKFYLEWTF